ncbi:LysE family translocator, partial [Shewanella baltica]|uniref:LysE family translocator n=1 Tax=Shewanella baltica TaxID=62322 RepID=UPI003D7A378C
FGQLLIIHGDTLLLWRDKAYHFSAVGFFYTSIRVSQLLSEFWINPKVALFFLSFLPQFIDPLAGSTSIQLLTLGLIFSLLATLCNVLYASAGSWVFSRPNSQRYSRALEGISGVLLIGLASKVMTSDR